MFIYSFNKPHILYSLSKKIMKLGFEGEEYIWAHKYKNTITLLQFNSTPVQQSQ